MEARNANYTTICRQLTFISRAWFEEEAPAAAPGARGKLGLPTLVAAADSAGVPAIGMGWRCLAAHRGALWFGWLGFDQHLLPALVCTPSCYTRPLLCPPPQTLAATMATARLWVLGTWRCRPPPPPLQRRR